MVFAINEINQNMDILPNITLGFSIFDSCYSEIKAIQGIMWILTGRKLLVPNFRCQAHPGLAGIIGELPAASSLPIARILGLYRYPQISYGSALSLLSDKMQFPSFLRTVPNSLFESYVLCKMILDFGWTWVGILYSEDDFYRLGSLTLQKEITRMGGCIAFFQVIPSKISSQKILQIAQLVMKSTASVVVLYTFMLDLIPVMEELALHNLKHKVWIASTAWIISPDTYKKQIRAILNGTIGFALQRAEIPGLKQFLRNIHPFTSPDDIFVQYFWEQAFVCRWPDQSNSSQILMDSSVICTGNENLENIYLKLFDFDNLRISYTTYNAVYAVAHALHNLFMCTPGRGPFADGACANISAFQPWQILHYIKNVHFSTKNGDELFFDASGDPPPFADLLNLNILSDGTNTYHVVGNASSHSSQQFIIYVNTTAIMWSGGFTELPTSVCSQSCQKGWRKMPRKGEPLCCFDCVVCSRGMIANQTDATNCISCPEEYWSDAAHEKCVPKITEFLSYEEPLGTALTAFAILFSLVTVSVIGTFLHFRETPIVKANNREISYLLLLSLLMCFLCSLLFIGQPQTLSCMLRQAAFGIVFSLCLSSILAKTFIVIIAFRATKPGSSLKRWVGSRVPYSVVTICSSLQVLICMFWMVTSPSFSEWNKEVEEGKIIIQCNEGSAVSFWFILGYLGILGSISLILAFFARKLPDSFNEAKFITFSMLVFASVWLSFIPAYLTTKGKAMVAVEIFAILCSTAGILFCIFSPKCYIILLKPERNTRQYLMGKDNST
ncbi:extracellular calcium-sensing receptor-like [Protopterus annectens]|uniref:extracellular calcium-sensing receptor-like n=1 Tax=Protopterus annectens TaxID=7888 RepID=UPI001CFC0EF2|nr:extracellular calcium-sensing receptor-like [Protopterus annectens]